MSKNKIMEEEVVEEKGSVVEVVVKKKGDTNDSIEKENFKAMMETYKKQNPVKYAAKEKQLLAKLNTL